MIFTRALLTDGVQVRQVKAYHTELATTCPCMALTEIHDSKIHRTSTWDIANDIHELPGKRSDPQGVYGCLGLDSILACLLLLNFCPHMLAPLPTISPYILN